MCMKKVMLLGVREADHPFAAALRKEPYEVVAGCQEAAARFASSDSHVMIGNEERGRVVATAARLGVAGILGIGEEAALTASYAAGRLDLPGVHYPEERLMHNLLLLREFQRDHGFRVPAWRDISLAPDVQGLQWPLCVSPADGDALRYMVCAQNQEELAAARQEALRHSPGGYVIAQECPTAETAARAMLVSALLVVRQGELMPILWCDCDLAEEMTDYVPSGVRYPSRLDQNARYLLCEECTRMITLLGLQNAEVPVLVYYVPGEMPYLLHLGIRDDRYVMARFWSHLYRQDLLRDTLRLAAGDPPHREELREPREGTCLAYHTVRTRRHGILRRLRLHKALQPYLRECWSMTRQSTHLDGGSQQAHTLGTLILRFPDETVMEDILGRIGELVEVGIDDFPQLSEQSV